MRTRHNTSESLRSLNAAPLIATAPGRSPAPGPVADAVPQPRRAKLSPLVIFSMILVVVSYGRAHELFPSTAALPVGKVMLPIGLFLLVTRPDFRARLLSLKTPQGRFLGLFLAAILASVPFSLWIGGSVAVVKDFALSKLPYLVILIGTAKTEEELDWLLRAVVISIIIFGLVIVSGKGYSSGGRAFASGTYDPNDIAMVAAISLPFSMRMLQGASHLWRAVGIAGLGSALLLVLQTGSRGGMLAVGAVVLAYLLIFRRSIPGRMKALLVAGIAVALASAPGVFLERLNTLGDVSSDYNMTDPIGRVEIWKRGIGYFLHRPVTGVGVGQFNAAEGESARFLVKPGEGFKWSTAHNSFVLAAAELGLPGLIGFLGLFFPIFPLVKRIRRVSRMERSLAPFAALGEAIAIGTICFLVAGFFLSATYEPAALTLAGFGIAYAGIAQRTAGGFLGRRPAAPARRR